jgi:hypothetical protein
MPEQNNPVYGETFEVQSLWGQRRHHPRYLLNAPVEFIIGGELRPEAGTGGQAGVKDISLGGLGVGAPEPTFEARVPPIGSRVRVQLSVEGETGSPLTVEGVVVHADPRRGFGVSFSSLTAELRKRVKQLLAKKVSVTISA